MKDYIKKWKKFPYSWIERLNIIKMTTKVIQRVSVILLKPQQSSSQK